MRLRQLSDLRSDVRKRAQIEGATTYIPDADITEYVNQAWTRVYACLCRTGEDYYMTEANFTSVAGQDTYTTTSGTGPAGTTVLPTDMWTIKGVDLQFQSTQWIPCYRAEFEQRDDYQNSNAWAWPSRPMYFFRNSGVSTYLRFLPVPNSSQTIKVTYYPVAVRLIADGDTLDGENGWERWVVDVAARWAAEKDENYDLCARLDGAIAKWEADVKAEAASRNTEEAPRMRQKRYKRRGLWGPGYGGFGL